MTTKQAAWQHRDDLVEPENYRLAMALNPGPNKISRPESLTFWVGGFIMFLAVEAVWFFR